MHSMETKPEWTTADRLRKARSDAQLSQEQLAVAAGLSGATIARWERGQISPSVDGMRRIAQITAVSVAWLIGEAA